MALDLTQHGCQQHMTHYPDLQCWDASTFYVAPIGRPRGGQYSCTQHLAKACRVVAARTDGAETVHVVILANLPKEE